MTEIIKNQHSLEKKVRGLSKGNLRSLNELVYRVLHNEVVFPSQTTLAERTSLSRGHQNRSLGVLEELDLISKEYRHLQTCIYEVNPDLFHPAVVSLLKDILPNLRLALGLILTFALGAPSGKNVTQLKDIYINQPVLRYNQVDYSWFRWDKNQKTRELSMKTTISPAIENIKSLFLTKRGQIELSPFPDHIIEKADREVRSATKIISHPVAYFRSIGIRLCKEAGITPNWGIIQQLLVQFNIPVSDPFLSKPGINREPLPAKIRNNHKQEGIKKVQEWNQPEYKRFEPKNMIISEEKKDFILQRANEFQKILGLQG